MYGVFQYLAPEEFWITWLSSRLTLSGPDKKYSKNVSCTKLDVFTFIKYQWSLDTFVAEQFVLYFSYPAPLCVNKY